MLDETALGHRDGYQYDDWLGLSLREHTQEAEGSFYIDLHPLHFCGLYYGPFDEHNNGISIEGDIRYRNHHSCSVSSTNHTHLKGIANLCRLEISARAGLSDPQEILQPYFSKLQGCS